MEESLERLRKEFPEMDPTVLEEALVSHSNNYFRASEALKAKYYKEGGIVQETPFWAPFLASLVGSDPPHSGSGASASSSDWFAPLQDGIAVVGEQLMQAAQAVVEVLPELKFWEDEEEYYYEDGRPSGRDDPDEVVAASGAAAAHVKRRGASLGGSRSTPGRGRSLEEEETPTSELVGKED